MSNQIEIGILNGRLKFPLFLHHGIEGIFKEIGVATRKRRKAPNLWPRSFILQCKPISNKIVVWS